MDLIFYIACAYMASGAVFAVSCFYAPLVDDSGRIVEESGRRRLEHREAVESAKAHRQAAI